MRVAVDARQMYRPGRRGIGKALVQLYRTLPAVRPDWRFVLLHRDKVSVPELSRLPNTRRGRVDAPAADRFDLWERVLLPVSAWWHRADVLHCPANTAPGRCRLPVVMNVHDTIPLDQNGDAKWAARTGRLARRAARVLTGSLYSKGRIAAGLGVPVGNIDVVPWAADPAYVPGGDPAVRAKYGLADAPYLFGFGAGEPRKNTARLIAAFAGLPAGLRQASRLVLVGVQGDAAERFRRHAVGLGVGDRVRIDGYVPDADVPSLLAGATALVYPSTDEGFGLPVLDAFACRVPVLAGDRTSIPEVAAGAALLVDPADEGAIGQGMKRLLTDPALRAGLVERGTARGAEFRWERTAAAVATVFEVAAGARRERIRAWM
jgi:alpha-1,3-rhamnosyl/mannosyltransferase